MFMRILACLLAILAFLSPAKAGEKTEEVNLNDILFAAAVRKQANLRLLTGAGKIDRALLWKAIATDHDAFGRDHPVVAYDYALIGDVVASEGGVQEAQSYYILALTILTRAFGPDHPRTLSTFDKLTRIAGALRMWVPSSGKPPAHNLMLAQR
jgi:hypothetical protein